MRCAICAEVADMDCQLSTSLSLLPRHEASMAASRHTQGYAPRVHRIRLVRGGVDPLRGSASIW